MTTPYEEGDLAALTDLDQAMALLMLSGLDQELLREVVRMFRQGNTLRDLAISVNEMRARDVDRRD